MTQFTDPKTLSKVELEDGTVFAPKFDSDGLVTAITIDADSKDVLMVAFMNAEAIAETLRSGFATYFSRSRNALWKKGESSGELQEVVELRTDCDQDAIVVAVNQTGRGAACHTGKRTCFYRRIVSNTDGVALEDTGAPKLFDPEDVYR